MKRLIILFTSSILLILCFTGCSSVKFDVGNQNCPIYLSEKTGMSDEVFLAKTVNTGKSYVYYDYQSKTLQGDSAGSYEYAKEQQSLSRFEFVNSLVIKGKVEYWGAFLGPAVDTRMIQGNGNWYEYKVEDKK